MTKKLPDSPQSNTMVVGIGSSAGGLKAIKALVQTLQPDGRRAYVLIQHMDPAHESSLAELASHWCKLAVVNAQDKVLVVPDQVYVIPPGQFPSIYKGHLQLSEPEDNHGIRLPIDFFFRSLAADVGPKAVGILLSGAGSDGTLGLRAIKERGGLCLVQDPTTADFDSMPRSAIEAGVVDHVLNVEDMYAVLSEYDRQTQATKVSTAPIADDTLKLIDQILTLVFSHTGRDFRGYKKSTVLRRIQRRMAVCNIQTLESYLHLITEKSEELKFLCDDLLIGVTAFFRDLEAYQTLATEVIPHLFTDKTKDNPLRVWIAGCSTGEEVYSIAILLFDYMTANQLNVPIQIFATDIDEVSLEVARSGFYPESIANDIGAEKLIRFFTRAGQGYRINKDIRECIVFAHHDLIGDPPFSRLDLIVCRNVLIYLEAETQKRLINLFEFILNKHGFLFLGSSETIGQAGKHFQTISKPWRIFRHSGGSNERRGSPPLNTMTMQFRPGVIGTHSLSPRASGVDRLYRHLLDVHGPVSVIINEQYEVLFAIGDTSPYLSLPSGEPSYDMFSLVKPALRSKLRTTLQRTIHEQTKTVTTTTFGVTRAANLRVRISVAPIQAPENQKLFLITFDEEPLPSDMSVVIHDENWLVQQLEQELQATREDLQRTIEQLRMANDDLKATNEESIAMNEELQSANEELESSKEELQSLNEELLTTNASLDAKVGELESINDDLNNLYSTTDIATIFLDTEFHVKRFTPACTRLMRLIPTDVGRPLTDIASNLIETHPLDDAQKVLQTLLPISREVQDLNGKWYIKRVLPYFTAEKRVIGLVFTFTDVTTLKLAQQEIAGQTSKLQEQAELLDLAHVLARDTTDKIIFWNRGAQELYGWTRDDAIGRVSHELLRTQFPKPLTEILANLYGQGNWHGDLVHFTRDGRPVVVASNWVLYRDANGNPRAIVEVNNDITERKSYESQLLETHRSLAHLAHHDPLTQLPNRMLLQDRLQHGIDSAKLNHKQLALLFLDLDRFKTVNDSLGHPVGDRLLVKVTERLMSCLNPEQTLARFGGDEFAILLEGMTDITLASHIAGQIIEVLKPPFKVDEHEFYIGGSIGVSIYPTDAQNADGLIRAADAAMYLAKGQGRGNYQFYTPNLDQRAHRQRAIENRLRRVLDNNELSLHYQPQVDLKNGNIVGAEALVRWTDAELGQVPPSEFILIAEDTGQINRIGEWVAGEVCRQIKTWQTNGLRVPRISMNISAMQFQSEGLEKMLVNLLSKEGLEGSVLELELTERILLSNPEQAITTLGVLKGLGVRLSIDDFGTGYSSLHYLKHLRLDHIKVAREFVPEAVSDSDEMTIARAIVSLASGLGLECTVEGIETIQQMQLFKKMGCQFMQGYLYSPALPADKFAAMLRSPLPLPK